MTTLQPHPTENCPGPRTTKINDLPQPLPVDRDGSTNSTILLVDDDPSVLEGLRRVLQSEGWHVLTAGGGEQALEYLQIHKPGLMITDLSMAAVSGWDLLFHENLQRPDLPIFVITALPLSCTGGAERFAHEFFQKPIDFDALLPAVRRYMSLSGG